MQNSNSSIIVRTLFYLCLCAIYFLTLYGVFPVNVKLAKVLPLVFLLCDCIFKFIKSGCKRLIPVFFAILFSSLGDISWSFISMMAFFAVAHLFYIYAFSGFFSLHSGRQLLFLIILLAIVVPVFIFLLPRMNANGESPFLIFGGSAYLLLLSSMSFLAISQKRSHWFLFAFGSLLFVVSDCTIAINRFAFPVPSSGLIVMGTYYAAQFFLNCRSECS